MATAYERYGVPLTDLFTPHLVDLADLQPGQTVLDMACGTGVVARAAATRVGSAGRVLGADLSEEMLTTAAAHRRRGGHPGALARMDAGALALRADRVDATLCQFGLMLFPDPASAVREMARATRVGGVLAAATWGPAERAPAFAVFLAAVRDVIRGACPPEQHPIFHLGGPKALADLLAAAGLRVEAERRVVETTVRESAEEYWAWMSSTVGFRVERGGESAAFSLEAFPDAAEATRRRVDELLRPWRRPDGQPAFPMEAVIVRARV